jgi:hypothetical protein
LNSVCEKLLNAALRAKADEINQTSMTQAEKIKAMRQEYFRDVDELMASGKVVLPESNFAPDKKRQRRLYQNVALVAVRRNA